MEVYLERSGNNSGYRSYPFATYYFTHTSKKSKKLQSVMIIAMIIAVQLDPGC